MPADKDIFGEPATTPFARFVQGRALYPPTKIYESAEIVVQRLATLDLAAIFSELVEKGDCGGYYGVLPRSTWFAVIGNFLHYRVQPDPGPSSWREFCIAGLKLMLRRPLDLVFPELKDRKHWLNNVAPGQTWEKERLLAILKNTTDLEKYFREERLNAIKHVLKKPFVNPDDPKDQIRITVDVYVIKDLARLAIEKLLS